MSQHEPLHNRDAQEAREARADKPMTAADLSPLEREALALLRKDEPRDLEVLTGMFGSHGLRADFRLIRTQLWVKRLVKTPGVLYGFTVLTAEGQRLQAELTGGGE